MPDYHATVVANEMLKRASHPRDVTHMQLQKLVYIAHGWGLAIHDEALVEDRLEAWDYGPVFPRLYREFRHGDATADGFILDGDRGVELLAREHALLDAVWDRYGQYTAGQLSDMTHEPETPWSNVYLSRGRSAPISNASIRNHYLELGRVGREQQVG